MYYWFKYLGTILLRQTSTLLIKTDICNYITQQYWTESNFFKYITST